MDIVENTRFLSENRKSMGRLDSNYFILNVIVARKSSVGKHTNRIFEFHEGWWHLKIQNIWMYNPSGVTDLQGIVPLFRFARYCPPKTLYFHYVHIPSVFLIHKSVCEGTLY